MKKHTFLIGLVAFILLGAVSVSLAATPLQTGITEEEPQDLYFSSEGQEGIDSVGGSTLTNVSPSAVPIGTAFDLCFTVFVQSPDAEFMDHFDADLPDGWTVNSVAPDSVPPANGCGGALPPVAGVDADNLVYWQSTGYPPQTGCGAWSGGSGGVNFDFCTNITIPDATGAPWTLPWNYIGDGYGGVPHQVSGSYGPVEPQSPIMLTPELIEEVGCPCGVQQHELTVQNTTGYDTLVNLSYTIVSGAGICDGPASIFVPNGASHAIPVNFNPAGQPGDTVACQVTAVDETNPDNNDSSALIKHLISQFFDPAGWQLEPITNATPNQWAGSTVGTNPAAAGLVGYIVGGLAAGSSVINPDLQMYDPGSATWTQLADLPNPRFSPAVGWIDGKIYAAGGYDATFAATNDLQVYDPAAGIWDNTTPVDLPVNRGGGAGGVGTCSSGTGECLFHVGGGPDSSFANTTLETWEYDPGSNAWTQLDNKPAGSSPDGHILGTGVGCQGYIYVGGDYRGFHEFFRLDATQPSGSQWTQLANIPDSAGAMTPALVCKEDMGALVLIGGDPNGGWGNYNNTVYVYNIANDAWDGPLPQTLHVAQLGSAGWHMDSKVWTAGGTVGSGAIDPMPFESLMQITCDPDACYDVFAVWKEAPLYASNGDVFSYIINIDTQYLMTGFSMVDPLPDGVEYADNLSWNIGEAWYDPVENAVHWAYTPTQQIASPAAPVPLLQLDPDAAVDLVGKPETAGMPVSRGLHVFAYPDAVLWDNGPLVTHPGECSGVDASRLQTDLTMNTLGFGHQFLIGNRMADDFEVTNPLGWQIDQITFFAYQTNAPADPSPITGVYYQIWDGPPDDPASHVVFGDLATNRLVSSTFTNIQRDSGTSPCANNRYIFADVASAGVILPPGTYWIDWMTDGSLASGPWVPPITILGETTTGNALQYTTSSGVWVPALDSGTATQQGMPFIIEGEPVPPPAIAFDVTVTGHCGDVIANEVSAGFDGIVEQFTAATLVRGEALLSVAPPQLEASVCADSTGIETLSICNVGDCPLSWDLEELSPTTLAGSMPFAPVDIASKGGAPAEMSLSSPAPKHLAQPAAVAQPEAVLWDQPLSTVNQAAYVDQEFPDYPNYSSFLADDFSNSGAWLVNSIFIPGDGWNGFSSLMKATALTWQIYADNGTGAPDGDPSGGGNPPIWTLTLPPLDPHVLLATGSGGKLSDVMLNPPTPITLPPGDWWLVFYPTMEFNVFGQYGRQPADTTNGYAGQFINPGGGFGYGTDWQDWTVLGPTQQDIAFRLEGIVLPEMGAISWLSADPTSDALPGGTCQDVAVTFDATGLTPGDYESNLVILSNDLNTPTMTVTALLNVPEPVFGATFSWTPASPVAGTPVDFAASVGGGTPPFTYSWSFDDGSSGSGDTVSHVYTTAGTYSPELVVENVCGISTSSDTLTVEPSTIFTYLPISIKNH
jgi:N-acetylneuraminic acid mutarotase